MPFKGEFYYFYLHLKDYLKKKYKINCTRADTTITGQAFIEKIKDSIKSADLIIVDGSGGNPNVYYELAIAHELGKKVIHITQDESNNIPSDTRHIVYIQYNFENQKEFQKNIDNAVEYAFRGIYEDSFYISKRILLKFESDENVKLVLENKIQFIKRLKEREMNTRIPHPSENFDFSNYIFSVIVKNETVELKAKFTSWLVKD